MLPQLKDALASRRILVTGGTGFIGGRLIEKLMSEHRLQVRVLVRDLSRACRIARYPVEIVRGDVTDPEAVDRAVRGCNLIFHCAYGNSGSADRQRAVNVEGTRHVLEAAVRHKTRRVVHLSTLLVYGDTPDGDLDERADKRYFGHVYADSKLDAERLIASYVNSRGLEVAVLQPAAVFGPHGMIWTECVLKQLKTSRMILINGGDGLCNPVYVDDLVSAMMLAAVIPQAAGESFLISGSGPVTWKQFYSRYEEMLGISATVNMSAEEARALYEAGRKRERPVSIATEAWRLFRREPEIRERLLRSREPALLLAAARRLIPAYMRQTLRSAIGPNGAAAGPQEKPDEVRPLIPLDPLMIRFFQAKTRVRIDKAKRVLGYEPVFSLEAGMRLTKRWAKWSNLLEPEPAS